MHITHFRANLYYDATSFKVCIHIPILQWCYKQHRRFYSIDSEAILGFETPVRESMGKMFTLPHHKSRVAVFFCLDILKEQHHRILLLVSALCGQNHRAQEDENLREISDVDDCQDY